MLLIVTMVFILQGVAFFTLMERHILGLTQMRYGPKKSSLNGILQPLIDGLKLLSKEQILVFNTTPSIFLGVTVFTYMITFGEWLVLPYFFSFLTMSWGYLFMLILMGVNIYPILLGGIFSKSKYSYLGGLRSSVATVSYEIIFSLNILVFMLYNKKFFVEGFFNFGLLLLFFSFFISMLVEISRAPFDYSESESELVSGFNTEYSSVGFVLFFLKEYSSLLFFSVLTSNLFFGGFFLFSILIFTSIVGIRSSYPRVRYDFLMGLFWLQLVFFICIVLWTTYMMLVMKKNEDMV